MALPQRPAVVAKVQEAPLFEHVPHSPSDVQLPAPAQVPPPQFASTVAGVQPMLELFEQVWQVLLAPHA